MEDDKEQRRREHAHRYQQMTKMEQKQVRRTLAIRLAKRLEKLRQQHGGDNAESANPETGESSTNRE